MGFEPTTDVLQPAGVRRLMDANEVVIQTAHFSDVVRIGSWRRDAGGSRTHFDRVAAGGLAVWLQRRVGEYPRQARQESNDPHITWEKPRARKDARHKARQFSENRSS